MGLREWCDTGTGLIVPTYDDTDPNNWAETSTTRTLQLSDRDDSLFCIVDAVDWPWINELGLWFATASPKYNKRYAARSKRGSNSRNGFYKHQLLWLHKEILKRFAVPETEEHCIGDHKNGNSLDNRRCNLRYATKAENQANKKGWYWRQPCMFEAV